MTKKKGAKPVATADKDADSQTQNLNL